MRRLSCAINIKRVLLCPNVSLSSKLGEKSDAKLRDNNALRIQHLMMLMLLLLCSPQNTTVDAVRLEMGEPCT
jgi:hypothetical protein